MLESRTQDQKLIRSFGRVKGRKLSAKKQALFDNLLPKYNLSLSSIKNSQFKIQNSYLEIGSGFGDFIFENAKRNPDINYIACETHINGIVNLLSKLEKEPLDNIKILNQDVRLFLSEVEDNSFKKVYILFPDPWPKSKHYKRRLINEDFLELIANKMNIASKLIIATDHDSYKRWILAKMIRDNRFQWLANSKGDWQDFPEDWVYTKYQRKAEREGRKSIFLSYLLFY